jgi:phage repressor protein C with HTH and peptisase S24 domain
MIKFIKVTGESLSPVYQEGDFVMLITNPFFSFKRGDTIVFRHAEYGTMIKNIDSIDSDKIQVIGTHAHSVDSRLFGPIERSDVIGKVVWHIRKPTS